MPANYMYVYSATGSHLQAQLAITEHWVPLKGGICCIRVWYHWVALPRATRCVALGRYVALASEMHVVSRCNLIFTVHM